LKVISSGKIGNLSEIRGIGVFAENNEALPTYDGTFSRHFPSAELISSMNEKAFPILLYDHGKIEFGLSLARIQTATKCGFSCGFCATSRITGPQTRKNVGEVIAYIEDFLKIGINTFFFEDATFAIDKIGKGVFTNRQTTIQTPIKGQAFSGWTDEFLIKLGELQKNYPPQRIRYGIQTRVDSLISEAFIHELAKSGCKSVFLGIETLNRNSLISMHKGTLNKDSDLEKIFAWLTKNNINATAALIVGTYTGGLDNFVYTLEKLNHWKVSEIFLQGAAIYPGTADWQGLNGEDQQNVVLSYLCPNSKLSKVSSHQLNPEDQMQYVIDEPTELEKFYQHASRFLRQNYAQLNNGHYIRKDIFSALKGAI
jgi:hypothetical protein